MSNRLIILVLTYAFVLIIAPKTNAQAPSFSWVQQAGGSENEHIRGITVDNMGNSYITGGFEGSSTFGNITLVSNTIRDVFLAKYNTQGNLIWAVKGPEGGCGEAIVVDNVGNFYVTGNSFNQIFLSKYNTFGALIWQKQAGGNSFDIGQSLALDKDGNIYVTGQFSGLANFDTITLNGPPSGVAQVFVAKYNSAGEIQWAAMGGPQSSNGSACFATDGGTGIGVDAYGNCYVTGSFDEQASFGPFNLTSNGNYDLFLVKYDSVGEAKWAYSVGGSNCESSRAIAVDSLGNSYITGSFQSAAVDFGGVTLANPTPGFRDLFVAKFNTSGMADWAIKVGAVSNDGGRGLAIDDNSNCYVTGFFEGNVNFGNTSLFSTATGQSDAVVFKLNPFGIVQWAVNGGGPGSDYGTSIAVKNNQCYVTGSFYGSATFGNTTVSGAGNSDIFLSKLGSITGLEEAQTNSLSIYPNPFSTSFRLTLDQTGPTAITLTNVIGREVHRQVISAETEGTIIIKPNPQITSGVYLLRVIKGDKVSQTQIVKQ